MFFKFYYIYIYCRSKVITNLKLIGILFRSTFHKLKALTRLTATLLIVLLCLSTAYGQVPSNVDVKSISAKCHNQQNGIIRLALILAPAPVGYTWDGPSGSGSGSLNIIDQIDLITNLIPGPYQFAFTLANGNKQSSVIVVNNPQPLQGTIVTAINYNGFPLSCKNKRDAALKSGVIGGQLPYEFNWSTGSTQPVISNLGAGNYKLTVSDNNQCTYTTEIDIDPPPPIKVTLSFEGDECYGQNQGFIDITSITGGAPPYKIAFQDNPKDTQTRFTNLEAGIYYITITDNNLCEQQEAVLLPTAMKSNIDLGMDEEFYAGDTLIYTFNTNETLSSVKWSPEENIYQQNLYTTLLFPSRETSFHVSAKDTNGCLIEDQITIRPRQQRKIYVPNAFAPNDPNDQNKFLAIYTGGGVDWIERFQIFDRYGHIWFDKKQLLPNLPDLGWDGTQNGNKAEAGVYWWKTTLRYSDGSVESLQGDTTLIR
jgi:gliding motility-associated-like protein